VKNRYTYNAYELLSYIVVMMYFLLHVQSFGIFAVDVLPCVYRIWKQN